MHRVTTSRLLPLLLILVGVVIPHDARAQGFIGPSFGYNFSGDAGCPSATDCEDKNWNFGLSFGALGGFVGFEGEWTHESEFFGERSTDSAAVTTLMGNFMLAPKFAAVQPYALAGLGLIRTEADDAVGESESENDLGWNVGGGLLVFVHRNIGLKADVRYFYSFDAIEILGLDVEQDRRKLDFARAAFGVIFKF